MTNGEAVESRGLEGDEPQSTANKKAGVTNSPTSRKRRHATAAISD